MPVNEAIPLFEGDYLQHLTVHFDAAVTGKRFCGPLTTFQSDPTTLGTDGAGGNIRCAGPPATGGAVGGVVKYDVASGGKGGVMRGAGLFVPLTSGAAITAGDELQVDNTGRVVTLTTGRPVGKAHSAVAGANLDVIVETYPNPGLAHG